MSLLIMERVAGIEPASKGWKPFVLPLYYTRKLLIILHQKHSLVKTDLFPT